MTYFVTAHTNDKARLIVCETRTTDPVIALIVKRRHEEDGYIVFERKEA